MYEKVNPRHPDKVADRIAGALVDLAYELQEEPKIAVEVLVGHGKCHIIVESSVSSFGKDGKTSEEVVSEIVKRISGEELELDLVIVPQDEYLAENQKEEVKCGDNGIFKGVPLEEEEVVLARIANEIYKDYPTDGKYVINHGLLTICQSNASKEELEEKFESAIINPLGDWTGGTSVDTGATNRKLGSDMAQSATGGGLMGKDLSKADVSINIYCFLLAQQTKKNVTVGCSIGDSNVLVYLNDVPCFEKPYKEIVDTAREYIKAVGGFEKFAEWGLVR